MANSIITLFCLIEGETTSGAFLVEIASSDTITHLKKAIVKGDLAPAFRDVTPKDLTLWRASILDDNQDSVITVDALGDEKTQLKNPRARISNFFPESPDDTTYVIVQRPLQTRSEDVDPRVATLQKQLEILLDTSITVTIVVKGEEKKEISWSTSVDTATLDVFRKRVVAKYPHYANDKSLEIFCSSNGKSTILENDEDLREELKKAKKTPQKTLTVSFGTPCKNFSAWTLKEVCGVYGITEKKSPTYAQIPLFTGIQPATLDSDFEKTILAELKVGLGRIIDLMTLDGANEATKSLLVFMFLLNASSLFNQDMRLATQENLTGRRGNGPVDFSVHSREDDSCTLGVTEVKREDFDQGVAQNLVQLEAAITGSKKRKRNEISKSYGVVTDGLTWMFTECTIDEKEKVTFRRATLEETIHYQGNWQDKAEFVFKRLVWLWQRMVEEIPTNKDMEPPQKKKAR